MKRRRKQTPGTLVYSSDDKLNSTTGQWTLRTGALQPDIDIEGTAGVHAGGTSIPGIFARGTVRAVHSDPGKTERLTVRRLEKVVRRLGHLPNLEAGETVGEGGWFRFRRNLRFGVGHSDVGVQIKALIVVDRERIPVGLSVPGLMMNGSITHVRPPYATDELRTAPGSRSGSGTERLFNWLEEVRRLREEDPRADPQAVLAALGSPPRGTATALSMYRLFAEESWMASYLAEPLMHGAPCEGVGRASFVAVGEDATVVMGSPLYIRECPLPDGDDGSESFLTRIFGRSTRR